MNNVFLREKSNSTEKDKKFRMILNVKELNKHVLSQHFKMETLDTCIQMMHENCFMASLDLKDAYFSIPIDEKSIKYFEFNFHGTTYAFRSLPQGFKDSPRVFTKIMKPVLAHLRNKGIFVSIYIDDIYVQGDSYEECLHHVQYVRDFIQSLGFSFSEKSSYTPTQSLSHLGFILDSKNMTVTLDRAKRDKLERFAQKYRTFRTCTVRQLAKLIGSFVATFPAVQYGPLFYRQLEIAKIKALQRGKFNYEKKLEINRCCKKEILWWIEEGLHSHKPIRIATPQYFLTTDSSTSAWGAYMGIQASQGF